MIELLCIQVSIDFCEIDQLAGRLLRFCRDQAEHLRLAYDSAPLCALLGEETDVLQSWFELEIEEDWLDKSELAALAELLRGVARRAGDAPASSPEQAAAIAARAAADALDRAHGRRFAGVFRGRGVTHEIGPGDPIPVCCPPVKEIFRDDLGTNPARLGHQLHELRWLRLLPRLDRGHRVRLSFEGEHGLADISPDTPLGVAIPSGALSDLRFEHTSKPYPRFFHVRPRRSAAQREAILRLLSEADLAGVRILVLPELCVDEEIVQAVENWFARPGRNVSLLVCGSMHIERDGQQRNVSTVLLPGGRRLEHFKFNPFYVPLPIEDGTLAMHREDIVTHPSTITIAMCGDWSFTVLICKDFLEPDVDRILELLGVRLILVPACSPKTDIFEPIAGILAARNQAVVLIGNLADPGPDEPASAIVVRPTKKDRLQKILRSEIEPPHLLFFHFARSQDMDS